MVPPRAPSFRPVALFERSRSRRGAPLATRGARWATTVTVVFLSPLAALVGLLVLLPLLGALLRERRHARVRARLGVGDPSPRTRRPVTVALALLFGLLAVAAAQPVLVHADQVRARTDAEAYVLVDVSRSMLAAPAPGAQTRFERAAQLGIEVGRALPDVPIGVASMTDRPLPHLFPTADRSSLDAVLTGSLGIDRPPPAETAGPRATDLGSLVAFARDNYFSAQSVHRLVVLLTDGESRPFDPDRLAAALAQGGVELVVVRLWSPSERVFRASGAPESYRPDASAGAALARLAAQTGGGAVFSEDGLAQALSAARRVLGAGPVVDALERRRAVPLGPWIVLAGVLPLALCLGAPRLLAYCMLDACRGSSKTAGPRSRRAPAPRRRSSFGPRSSTGGSSPGGG